jgi:uncharacterized membrane protein
VSRNKAAGALLVSAYLIAIVAANLLVARYGPAVTPFTAFALIGLDLTCRDALHDRWQHRHLPARMGALIAAGSLLSWVLNRDAGRVALASCVAFGLAALADAGIYHTRRRRGWLDRSNTSNLAGALVDSLVFPTLAFGALLPLVVAAQFAAKVAGGLVWSLLLVKARGGARVAAGH